MPQTLQKTLDSLDIPSGVTLGIAVSLDDELAHLNGERFFQLASVVKVPILITAMRQMDNGRFSLSDRIAMKESDKTAGGLLAHLDEGLMLTWRDLLTMMIIQSDNTATDIVIREIGGVDVVTKTMHDLGFDGIKVHQTIRQLLDSLDGEMPLFLTDYDYHQYIKTHTLAPYPELAQNPDTSNFARPLDMLRLFKLIHEGKAASPNATAQMINILSRQRERGRIPSQLPKDLKIAHKTGSVQGVRNDAGIIYLPDGRIMILCIFAEYFPDDWHTPEGQKRASSVVSLIGKAAKTIYESVKVSQTRSIP